MANLATINDNILADSGIDPINLIVGTGTVNYIPKFTAEGSIGNSIMTESGANILISSNIVLHAGNYNNYAPTLTGGGASGTWGINISGNAATATNANNADTVDGLHASAFALAGGSNATGTWPISVTGTSGYANSAGVAGLVNGTSGGAIQSWDIRTIAPSNMTAGRLGFGFTSWGNNNTAPWADYLHLRSYTDGSGGNDNLVMFLKEGIGMRIYQQAWGSSAPYVTYVDVLDSGNFNAWAPTLTGGGASGTWGISITGNADTLDGYHASAFALASSLSNYLPLAGGTLTGQLTILSTNQNFQNLFIKNNTTATSMPTHLYQRFIARYNNDVNGTDVFHWIRDNWEYNITNNYGHVTIGASASGSQYQSYFTVATDGNVYATNSFRAPIFYDSNDANYYLDPNGTSNIYKLSFANSDATNHRNEIIVAELPTWGTGKAFFNDVATYGVDGYGLIIQVGYSDGGDVGGMKITDDGIIMWGAGDEDLFRLYNEDSSVLALRITDSNVAYFSTNIYMGGELVATQPWVQSNYVPTSRTLTINGVTYDLSANRSWTIAAGVTSIIAGTGIEVDQAQGDVRVSNTGVLSVNGSTGDITGIATTAQLAGYLPLAGGTMTGSIAMGGNNITNVSQLAHANGRIILSGNLHIDSFNGYAIYLQYYNQGVTTRIYGDIDMNNYNTTNVNIGYANNSFRAPIFYDSNDTTYYADFNSGGTSLKINGGIVSTIANGGILLKHEVSEANAWIFRENAVNWGLFWLNAGSQSGQVIGSYTTVGAELFGMNNAVTGYNPNSAWSGTDASTRAAWMLSNYSGYLWTQGTQYSETDMRAPIFYDSADTSYYLDPNSTSNLYSVYAYAYRGNGNVDGTGSASYHPSGIYSTGNNWLYGTLYMAGNNMRSIGGIVQNDIMGRPNVQWGAGGSTTGAVIIKFPGGTGNYGMVHAVIDIYEYNGNNVSTIIVGGHNWGSQWYSYGANVVGYTNKQVRVGVKDGQYCIIIGDGSSTWSYGQVVLRKIQNGSYYSGVMDVGAGYTIGIESDTYSWVSGDLRTFRSSGNMYMNENLVATQSWVNSQGFVTGGPFLPLSGGNATGWVSFSSSTQGTPIIKAIQQDTSSGYYLFQGVTGSSEVFRVDRNGSTFAPIFYDLNDTNYYLDPNSFSNLGTVRVQSLNSPNGNSVVAADSAMPAYQSSFIHTLAIGPGGNDGHILGMTWSNSSVYGAQIFLDTDPNDIMAIRSRSNAGVWTSWKTVLHSGNYSSYALPLSGGTMSGQIYGPTIGTGVYDGLIQVREYGYVSTSQSAWGYAPAITFHWGGRAAIKFGLKSDGLMAVDDVAIVLQNGGTWNINAVSSNSSTYLNSSNYIIQRGAQGTWNDDFQATPAGTMSYGGDLGASTTNGPGGTWWMQQNFRHTNGSNYWGVQVAWGWEDNRARLATRNVQGGNYDSWVYYLNSSNYTDYTVTKTGGGASGTWGINITGNSNYASSAGNADTVDGYHESAFMRYYGYSTSGNFQTFQATPGRLRFDQVGDISSGSWSNAPSGIYTYGGVLSYRGDNFGLQIYASHTGGMVYKTQWNDDQYSGWLRILDSQNYNSYSPTLTGGNASGTWGISITGNSNYASTSNYANSSGTAQGLSIVGYGSSTQTFYQTPGTFAGYSGWASYLVSSHGDGATYYNQTIIMPFWGAPQYSRLEGGTFRGPYIFVTTENSPYAYNMNQYVRTTDSPTFFGTLSISADGSVNYTGSRIWLYSHSSYRGSGVYMSLNGGSSTWYAGSPYTDFSGYYMIGYAAATGSDAAADPGNRKWQVTPSGNTYQTGSATATGFFEISDARLKTIVDEDYRVDSIVSIKPKFYQKNGKFEVGYIAQEVEGVYAHAVSLGDDGYLSLSYTQVHTLKIAALEDSVDDIKKKIKELEEKLNTLY